jgi:hypothetical protein
VLGRKSVVAARPPLSGEETAGNGMRAIGVDQMMREGIVKIEAGEVEPGHLAELSQRELRLDQGH